MHSFGVPSSADLWKAIGIYLRHAYPSGQTPATVQQRLEQLRHSGDHLWESPVIERSMVNSHTRYALRLGNPAYPHMKLAVERAPDGRKFLLRVDTHDRHIRPQPGSRDCAAFTALQERNLKLASEIESAWADESLMTFKEYLRQDLQQRSRMDPST